MSILSDRVAIVTGAGRGIGRAIAERLAQDGAAIVIAERDPETAHHAAEAITANGQTAIALPTDVSDRAQVESLVAKTVDQLGQLDILVNNAAVSLGSGFLETSDATWNQTLAVNLTGVFLCGQVGARAMIASKTRGRIINIASVNSYAAEQNAAAYVASKGGVALLTRAMAVDLAHAGILVNAIAPGAITTDLTKELDDAAPLDLANVPLRRYGSPSEIAGVVSFLASDDASFITGSTILVDAGRLAYLRP